jgi:glycosyl transferase family 2
MKTAVIVTTYNRPACLTRSLPQIVAAAKEVGAPVLVVDDGSVMTEAVPGFDEIAMRQPRTGLGATWIWLPENRGLAGALNIGLSYWLADPSIDVIHYFQDDVDVDPLCIVACNEGLDQPSGHDYLVTGHDAREHREKGDEFATIMPGMNWRQRKSCRATHMSAHVSAWKRVMPIRSRGLGLPGTRIMDGNRGTGSGVDWYIVRDSPNRLPVFCIPGLVRSFAHKAKDSTWLNESIGGEEPALSRDSIKSWLESRK